MRSSGNWFASRTEAPPNRARRAPRRPGLKRAAILAVIAVLAGGPACAGKRERIAAAFDKYGGPYVVYVSKKDFRLEVYDRSLERAASYVIAYGSNPDGGPKLHEGDNRTPEGTYHVTEMLSMDADRESPAYRRLRDLNRVYFRAKDGHGRFGRPGVDLGDNAYGPRFFALDYPSEDDRRRFDRARRSGLIGDVKGIGFGIAIHGNNDEESMGHRSSSGCIRMYNRDIVDFERYVRVGMPVIISPR